MAEAEVVGSVKRISEVYRRKSGAVREKGIQNTEERSTGDACW
jgi:hypothetical protein